jgi:hypothetical protein
MDGDHCNHVRSSPKNLIRALAISSLDDVEHHPVLLAHRWIAVPVALEKLSGACDGTGQSTLASGDLATGQSSVARLVDAGPVSIPSEPRDRQDDETESNSDISRLRPHPVRLTPCRSAAMAESDVRTRCPDAERRSTRGSCLPPAIGRCNGWFDSERDLPGLPPKSDGAAAKGSDGRPSMTTSGDRS